MKTFKQFEVIEEEHLEEKAILLNHGKQYGQICFLAGGAGSGKGFAAEKFIDSSSYKIRDVDEWKRIFMKIGNLQNKYPEIRDLNLKNPDDVSKLHDFLDKKKIKERTMSAFLKSMSQSNKENLPNIMFDITAKNTNSIKKMMPPLLAMGYNPANIHLIWILTNYEVAIDNNSSRERVVSPKIMLLTHTGAANTVYDLARGVGTKLALNGQVHVILNNRQNTVKWPDTSKEKKDRTSKVRPGTKNDDLIIKQFKYLTLKERGKSWNDSKEMENQLARWIIDNIPDGELKKTLKKGI